MRRFLSDQSARKQIGEGFQKKKFIGSLSHTPLVMITVHFARGVENEALPLPSGLSVCPCEHA